MNSRTRLVTMVFVCACPLGFSLIAQNFDYHSEGSPAVSWHEYGSYDSRRLALGGISLGASPLFGLISRPASLSPAPGWRVALSLHMLSFQAFQFRGLNEGVITAGSPVTGSKTPLPPSFGIGWAGKKAEITFGFRHLQTLDRPSFPSGSTSPQVMIKGQKGAWYGAFSWRIGPRFSLGAALEWVTGTRSIESMDSVGSGTTYSEQESHRLSGIRSSLGILVGPIGGWRLGLLGIIPFQEKVRSTLTCTFVSLPINFHIEEKFTASDLLVRPFQVTLDCEWTPPGSTSDQPPLRLLLELVHTRWESYRFLSFGVESPGHMRNTLQAAVAVEGIFRIFEKPLTPRFGIRVDPQPRIDPRINLLWISGGLGIPFGPIQADIGAALSSTLNFQPNQHHWLLTATITCFLPGGSQ